MAYPAAIVQAVASDSYELVENIRCTGGGEGEGVLWERDVLCWVLF
jgi:hypothetical protein